MTKNEDEVDDSLEQRFRRFSDNLHTREQAAEIQNRLRATLMKAMRAHQRILARSKIRGLSRVVR